MIDILESEAIANDSILLRRIYVDITGDIPTALILAQIIYWNLEDHEGNIRLRIQRKGRYYLAKRNADWWDECRVNKKTAQRSIKKLKEMGIIETEFHKFSNTPMNHIWLNKEKLNEVIQKQLEINSDMGDITKSCVLNN